MAQTGGANAAALAPIRGWDRPRYYAALFAPSEIRADLFALYGFAAEIARIPDLVSEPTLGEIRLQFWRDQVEAMKETGGEGGPPALRALAEIVQRRALPVGPLLALIDARRADLYSDPPGDIGDLEGFLGETQSALFQLAALIAGSRGAETADLSGHAGVAYGLSRRLARLAADRARGRTVLPLDLLAGDCLSAADALAPQSAAALAPVVQRATNLAEEHLRRAREALRDAPPGARPVYLPLAVVAPLLARIRRLGGEIATRPAALSDLGSLTRIAWASATGRP